jgi:hypothetical protein
MLRIVHLYRPGGNIRVWDIGVLICKHCLVSIEAATEDQNLYPGIQTLFEAAEAGTGGSSPNPDPSRHTFVETPIFISKAESGERRVDFVELQHLAKIYRKPLSFFEVR